MAGKLSHIQVPPRRGSLMFSSRLALCGRVVHVLGFVDDSPTCPTCAKRLAERQAAAAVAPVPAEAQ